MNISFKHIARRVVLFLFIGISASAAQNVLLSLPDTTKASQNLVFNLPVSINGVSSLGITSAQLTLSFDPIALMPQGVDTTGCVGKGWTPVVNFQSGRIIVAMAGFDTLQGNGVLAYVRFKVQRNAPLGSSPLTLSNVLLNESITPEIVSGFFTPAPRPNITIGGLPQGIIGGESALLTAVGGVSSSYKWRMLSDTTIAAVDSSNGLFKAKKGGNAIVAAVDTAGFDGIDTIFVYDFRASIPDSSTFYNGFVDVPLVFSNVTGLGILSTQFKIVYDTAKVHLTSVIQTGTLSSGMTPQFNDSMGTVSFAFAGTLPLSGNGAFVKLRFASKGLSVANSSTPLNLVKFDANEKGPTYRFAATVNGSVHVLPNMPPVFTNIFDSLTINEDQQLSFDVDAIDPEGITVQYFGQSLPNGMTLDVVTGMLTWKPTFSQSAVYNFLIGARSLTDTGAINTITKNVRIRVNNVNRAPVFTNKLRDTTISENQSFAFQLAASDADSDSLIFGLNNVPTGMSFNPKQGIITWRPDFIQSGVYKLNYDVGDYHADGVLKDSAVITVLNVNRVPQFTNIFDSVTIVEGRLFTFPVTANDPDGDTVRFFISSAPATININSVTGVLSWQPSFSEAGAFNFVIGVRDTKPDTTKKNVKITVRDSVTTTNRAPVFTSVMPDVTIGIDSLFKFHYTASDPDSDRLVFSFVKTRPGAVLDSSGLFSWKPLPADLGIDTFIVSVADGKASVRDTALITVFGFPFAEISQTQFDFGSLSIGGTKTLTAKIKNSGYTPLIINSLPLPVANANFSFDSSLIQTIAPGDSQSFSIVFAPVSAGTHATQFTFITNDPLHPIIGITAQGTSFAKAVLKKKILVDASHHSSVALRDSLMGMTKLFSALTNSGIEVFVAETSFTTTGFDAVLLVTPQSDYTAAERLMLQQFVANGGLLVMMGNASNEPGTNTVLNTLLNDTAWTTGLSLTNNLVADSTHNYFGNPLFPVLTQFADTAHPYLRSVDSLVMFNSSSVLAVGAGVPFARFASPATEASGGGTTQAAIGLSKIGKGKLLVFGDATLWQNGLLSPMAESFNIDAQDNLTLALNIFTVTEDYEVKMPNPTPNEAYQLVSIPFDLQNAEIATVLQGLGGVNPLVWRLFGRYNPAVGAYSEFPSENFNTFRRGEAYWLITRGQFNLNFGSATVLPVLDFFPIKIGPGYSMIGNPFPYKVSWANSLKGDSVQTTLYKFNPAINDFVAESQTLDPFTGYFVKNLSQDSVTIYINPSDVSSLAKQKNAALLNEDEWRISVGAASGKARDSENYAGVSRSANVELDKLDAAEPPTTPTDYVSVQFTNPQWKQHSGSYAVDIRPITDEGTFWDLEVTTARKQSSVSLSLASLGNLPTDFIVYLIDKKSERAERIDYSSTYDFTMGKNEQRREFRLIAGKKEFVENNTGGIPLTPKNFALAQNYPNPFNPSTTIRYTVGHSGDVSVTIYNLLGQKVRTLINEARSIGTYDVEWDAKNDRGVGVATGVYFYRITVKSEGEQLFSETKKMVLMK